MLCLLYYVVLHTSAEQVRIFKWLLQFSSQCTAVGVTDPTIIPDSSFTASSSYSSYYKPHFARLRGLKRGWTPLLADRDSKNSFLQIDLRAVYSICAVATQGEHGNDFDEWTKSYKLQFSLNGSTWAYYKENGTDKVRFLFFLHILRQIKMKLMSLLLACVTLLAWFAIFSKLKSILKAKWCLTVSHLLTPVIYFQMRISCLQNRKKCKLF